MKKIKIVRQDGSLRIQTVYEKPTKTQQHMAEACDINNVMNRWLKKGETPQWRGSGRYADLTEFDYQAALDITIQAKQSFAALPSRIRTRFENDPRKLLEFIGDPANKEECVKLGLFEVQKTPEPTLSEVLTDLKTTITKTTEKKPVKKTTS